MKGENVMEEAYLKPYRIITADSREGLETLIEQTILQGYRPQGGIETIPLHGHVQFLQAIRLEELE